MDFEAQRKKRMEDLALKRKRLEEMRKQRSEKNVELESHDVATPPPPAATLSPDISSVDDLVNSLLSSDKAPPPITTQEELTISPPAPILSRLEQIRLRSAEWTTCQNVCSFTIQPVVPEVYEKGIQTEASTDPMENNDDNESEICTQESSSYFRSPQRPRQRSRGDSAIEEESMSKPVTSAAPLVAYSAEEVNSIVVGLLN